MTVQCYFYFFPKNLESRSERSVRLVPRFFWGFPSIGGTIRTRREIQCLPYAGFFLFVFNESAFTNKYGASANFSNIQTNFTNYTFSTI